MTSVLIHASGVLAGVSVWLFLMLPAWIHGVNLRTETVSTGTTRSKKLLRVVNLGLVTGGVCQLVFVFYLLEKFDIGLLSLGSIFFAYSGVACAMVAVFTLAKYPKFHKFFTSSYFVSQIISEILVAIYLYSISASLTMILLIVSLVNLFGLTVLLIRYKQPNFIEQHWAFFWLCVWIMTISVY
jgi:hypothetical protein